MALGQVRPNDGTLAESGPHDPPDRPGGGAGPTAGGGREPAGSAAPDGTSAGTGAFSGSYGSRSSRSAPAARSADYLNPRRGRRSAPALPDSGVTGGPVCGSCDPQPGGSAVWQLGFGRGRLKKGDFSALLAGKRPLGGGGGRLGRAHSCRRQPRCVAGRWGAAGGLRGPGVIGESEASGATVLHLRPVHMGRRRGRSRIFSLRTMSAAWKAGVPKPPLSALCSRR